MITTATQVDTLIHQLAEYYTKFCDYNPNSFLTENQQYQRDLAELKEYFRMKSLEGHFERAIPAIIHKCKEQLRQDSANACRRDRAH